MSDQQQYNNDMSGALFKNDKRGNPKAPDMTGEVTIEGHKWRLAAWAKDTRSGRILSIAVSEPRDKQESQQTTTDDDLPF